MHLKKKAYNAYHRKRERGGKKTQQVKKQIIRRKSMQSITRQTKRKTHKNAMNRRSHVNA